MANDADQIVQWCEDEWDRSKSDCSGFVKAVSTRSGESLFGQANQTIYFLGTSNRWENLGADAATATARAVSGSLVIGGLKQRPHGHVVIVVKSAPPNYPVAYWGRVGAVGRKNTTVNWSWNRRDLALVHYFAAVL